MGMILYNPTQIKRKVINQVICLDACTYLRFVTEIQQLYQLKFYNIGLYFMLLLHMALKTLLKPTNKGKVKLKYLDSK